MTTLVPRQPYTPEELATLYPRELELQLVQVVRLRTPAPLIVGSSH